MRKIAILLILAALNSGCIHAGTRVMIGPHRCRRMYGVSVPFVFVGISRGCN